MDPNQGGTLQKLYELEKENNRILRAMRRSATIGSIFRFLFLTGSIAIPIWLYITYVSPMVNQAMGTLNAVQGQVQQAQEVGQSIMVPFSELSGILEKLKATLPKGLQQ